MTLQHAFHRHPTRSALTVAILLAASAIPARAEDLPAALTAAAAQLGKPGTSTEMPCQTVSTRSGQAPPASTPDQFISVLPTDGYSSSTVGAYLDYSPAGGKPSPFVQALLEAGAIKAVPLAWGAWPAGATAASSGNPGTNGVAYLVTGPDRVLFTRPRTEGIMTPTPPGLPGGSYGVGRGNRPAEVWGSDTLCFRLVPDRVLEHSEPVAGNGVTDVVAVVLFHPELRPAWLADQRVIKVTRPMPAHIVQWLRFRNNGDGWRLIGPSGAVSAGRMRTVGNQ